MQRKRKTYLFQLFVKLARGSAITFLFKKKPRQEYLCTGFMMQLPTKACTLHSHWVSILVCSYKIWSRARIPKGRDTESERLYLFVYRLLLFFISFSAFSINDSTTHKLQMQYNAVFVHSAASAAHSHTSRLFISLALFGWRISMHLWTKCFLQCGDAIKATKLNWFNFLLFTRELILRCCWSCPPLRCLCQWLLFRAPQFPLVLGIWLILTQLKSKIYENNLAKYVEINMQKTRSKNKDVSISRVHSVHRM